MKIYTKTGDKGETGLFGGKRVSKSDLRVEVYGALDELNSAIGMAFSEIEKNKKLVGGKQAAILHHARTICRRAERRAVELLEKEHVPLEIIAFLNRLSDLLFAMARLATYQEGKQEIKWRRWKECNH